jgi:hypothetical protein
MSLENKTVALESGRKTRGLLAFGVLVSCQLSVVCCTSAQRVTVARQALERPSTDVGRQLLLLVVSGFQRASAQDGNSTLAQLAAKSSALFLAGCGARYTKRVAAIPRTGHQCPRRDETM